MSQILETYAKDCGVDIGEPFIYQEPYIIDSEKYIVLQTGAGMQAKVYSYWEEVFIFIKAALIENKIDIVIIGEKNDSAFKGCIDLRGKTNLNETANIIQNAALCVATDSFSIHIASYLGIPTVSIYSNVFVSNACPYFKNEALCLYPDDDLKPSFSDVEENKRIDTIAPEEISKAIIEMLKIDFDVKESVEFIGKNYKNVIFELIPSDEGLPSIGLPRNSLVNLRMDEEFNDKFLSDCSGYFRMNVMTDRPIHRGVLQHCGKQILMITYYIKDFEDRDIKNLRKCIEECETSGTQFMIIADKKVKEEKPEFLLDFFDYNLIIDQKGESELDLTDKYFFTKKMCIKGSKLYPSLEHCRAGEEISESGEAKCINSNEFKESIEHYLIYEKI